MLIKATYENLTTALNLLTNVTSTKGLQDELKVANFYIENGVIKAVATDGKVFCLTKLDGQFDLEGLTEEDSFVAIKLKEMTEILDKFRGLQRTQVTSIELLIKEHGIVMTVNEEAKSSKGEKSEYADLYNQSTRFKLTKLAVKTFVKTEIPTLVIPDEAVEVPSADLQLYLDYFYTPMGKPKDPVILHFKADTIYAVMGNVYAVMMENRLPDLFQKMSLTHNVVGFLKNLMPTVQKFKIHKAELENGRGVILTVEIGQNVIKIKTTDTTDSVNIEPFKAVPGNMVVVDKLYLMDALKRVELMDQAFVRIEIKDGDAKMNLTSLKTTQEIPVKTALGEGTYSFMLRPDHLSQIIFSHITKANKDVDDVHICMQTGADGKTIQLTCKDITNYWSTKYPKAPIMETPAIEW